MIVKLEPVDKDTSPRNSEIHGSILHKEELGQTKTDPETEHETKSEEQQSEEKKIEEEPVHNELPIKKEDEIRSGSSKEESVEQKSTDKQSESETVDTKSEVKTEESFDTKTEVSSYAGDTYMDMSTRSSDSSHKRKISIDNQSAKVDKPPKKEFDEEEDDEDTRTYEEEEKEQKKETERVSDEEKEKEIISGKEKQNERISEKEKEKGSISDAPTNAIDLQMDDYAEQSGRRVSISWTTDVQGNEDRPQLNTRRSSQVSIV